MRLYRDTMYIAPAGRERLRRAGLDTVERVLKCLGHQVVAWSRSTETVRVDLPAGAGAGAVFVKRYHLLRWKVRIKAMFRGAFFGRSRAHAEFDRLERMRSAGAPVVDPVAWGERRILHFVRFSFLITEAVDGAVSLTTFAQNHADGQRRPLSFRDRRALVESLGRCIGELHGRGLAHGALFWRNVLVRKIEPGRYEFVLLDAPGRRRLRIAGADRPLDGTLVMGVVNASPESFSDAGRFAGAAEQRAQCAALVDAGADIVDIGGQSAITNQPELDAAVEIDRVVPLVEWVRSTLPGVLVSVDTYKPAMVEAALEAGAHIINDVSGLRYPAVAESCARAGAALVVMHTAAPPKVRLQDRDLYGDVVTDVVAFLRERVGQATAVGLPWESVILDPGPDFTKTPAQTVALLRGLDAVWDLGRPVLLALSRKDFLGAITAGRRVAATRRRRRRSPVSRRAPGGSCGCTTSLQRST